MPGSPIVRYCFSVCENQFERLGITGETSGFRHGTPGDQFTVPSGSDLTLIIENDIPVSECRPLIGDEWGSDTSALSRALVVDRYESDDGGAIPVGQRTIRRTFPRSQRGRRVLLVRRSDHSPSCRSGLRSRRSTVDARP